jgi:hypothetical protein
MVTPRLVRWGSPEHGGRCRCAPNAGDQFAVHVVVGDRQQAAGGLDNSIVLNVGVLVAVSKQLNGGEDQQQPEQQEDHREQRQQGRASSDDDGGHDQSQHDAEGQQSARKRPKNFYVPVGRSRSTASAARSSQTAHRVR